MRSVRAPMPLLIIQGLLFIIAVVFWLYPAILATWATYRDTTIGMLVKLTRSLVAWVVPLFGAMFALRAAAEGSAQFLPPKGFMWPARWMIPTEELVDNELANHNESPATSSIDGISGHGTL